MSELFRRHPINKAGAARAKRGKFLMLTMTCNLVQKGVIHLVTVMGKKGICVLLWGAEAEAPGRAGSRQAGHRASECWRVPFLEPPGLLCGVVGLRSCTGGCRCQLHHIFCLQSPGILSMCVSVSAHHCLSVKSSAVPSKALLIHCSGDSR